MVGNADYSRGLDVIARYGVCQGGGASHQRRDGTSVRQQLRGAVPVDILQRAQWLAVHPGAHGLPEVVPVTLLLMDPV